MSQPGFAGNRYIVDINGSAGAFTPILARSPVTRLVIDESRVTSAGAANTPTGSIDYLIPNDGTTNGFTTVFRATSGESATTGTSDIVGSQSLPIVLGNPIRQHAEGGEIIGNGPNVVVGIIGGTPATTLIQLRATGATATSVMVTEYN